MNYVAHAVLAPREPMQLLGSLLGDFIKGPLPAELDPTLAAGARLHRDVDAFVDRHPDFRRARKCFTASVSHYSAVVVDVVFDHVLLAGWPGFVDEDLDDFAERVYSTIEQHADHLPRDLGSRANWMRGFDAMRVYRDRAGLHEALRRMSRRLRRPIDLTRAIDDLERDHATVQACFRRLWHDLTGESGERRIP